MAFCSGRRGQPDWGLLLIAGLAGSFLGGCVVSLVSGDGLALKILSPIRGVSPAEP